jgi:hypothetical protein
MQILQRRKGDISLSGNYIRRFLPTLGGGYLKRQQEFFIYILFDDVLWRQQLSFPSMIIYIL